jgi:hypothetical protein
MPGSITLGEVAERLGMTVDMIEVACNRCDRRGRLFLDTLLEQYGADCAITDLRRIVAGDCARMVEAKMHDPCGVHFPELSKIF